MFTAPRFIVVDDKPAHLQAIMAAFQELGTPCMGIHYDPERGLEQSHFKGVRALFLDLHLIEGVSTTDNKRHYAQIASILEDNISPIGGPFILVLWTEHSHLASELMAYLDETLDAEKPHARPLAALPLAKEAFINVEDGSLRQARELREAIEGALASNPQLAALIGWEADVVAAAGSTLSALLSLVPQADRTTAGFPGAVDAILSRLAREAVGRSHVAADPRAAITAALAPILTDRIFNQDVAAETTALWASAVTRHGDKHLGEASSMEGGQINRMLHVALPPSERVLPTDWGAVNTFPAELWNNDALRDQLGVTIDELLREEFKIHRDHHARCRPCLVRIGAACDYAQSRRGPLSFLVGLEIPDEVDRLTDRPGRGQPPASEWLSPTLWLPNGVGVFKLAVNARYSIVRPPGACNAWQPRYRLREQLLMHLISHTSVQAARPGIVRL